MLLFGRGTSQNWCERFRSAISQTEFNLGSMAVQNQTHESGYLNIEVFMKRRIFRFSVHLCICFTSSHVFCLPFRYSSYNHSRGGSPQTSARAAASVLRETRLSPPFSSHSIITPPSISLPDPSPSPLCSPLAADAFISQHFFLPPS